MATPASTSSPRNKRGPAPALAPRKSLDPAFVAAVRASGLTLKTLAQLSHFPDLICVSRVLCSPTVVATPLLVGRLGHIADAIGYPRPQVFVESVQEPDGERSRVDPPLRPELRANPHAPVEASTTEHNTSSVERRPLFDRWGREVRS